jgi:hypothetical protein
VNAEATERATASGAVVVAPTGGTSPIKLAGANAVSVPVNAEAAERATASGVVVAASTGGTSPITDTGLLSVLTDRPSEYRLVREMMNFETFNTKKYIFTKITKWGTNNSHREVEIGSQHYYNGDKSANQVLEIEGHPFDAANFYTDIHGKLGESVHLSFDVAGRIFHQGEDSSIDVYWRGKLIEHLAPSQWAHKTYDFVATGESDRLEFRAGSKNNRFGGLLDNIYLEYISPINPVPALNSHKQAVDVRGENVHRVLNFESVDANEFTFTKFEQWQSDNKGGLVEIGQERIYKKNKSSNKVLELEGRSGDAANFYTEVHAEKGGAVHLGFHAAGRTGFEGENSSIDVYWCGKLIEHLSLSKWVHKDYNFTASGENDRLEFRAGSKNNGAGGIIDNIILDYFETHVNYISPVIG